MKIEHKEVTVGDHTDGYVGNNGKGGTGHPLLPFRWPARKAESGRPRP